MSDTALEPYFLYVNVLNKHYIFVATFIGLKQFITCFTSEILLSSYINVSLGVLHLASPLRRSRPHPSSMVASLYVMISPSERTFLCFCFCDVCDPFCFHIESTFPFFLFRIEALSFG